MVKNHRRSFRFAARWSPWFLLLALLTERASGFITTDQQARPQQASTTLTSSSSTTTRSLARRTPRPYDESDDEADEGLQRDPQPPRPYAPATAEPNRPAVTETLTATPLMTEAVPSKPKIVVLGATGHLGRWVVRQLLETAELQQATIVAVCRNYDKACRVLYDDLIVSHSYRHVGPKLQIVQGDLLSQGDVYVDEKKKKKKQQQRIADYEDMIDEQEWLQRAKSAAAFYGTKVSDYDDGSILDIPSSSSSSSSLNDNDEALREAIAGCTSIISCVGAVRPTNVWSDLMVRPLIRLLRRDVSHWCEDADHPYYTIYSTTQKAVEFAEEEQARRQLAFEAQQEAGGGELSQRRRLNPPKEGGGEAQGPPRIRFIRISDLCVTKRPWHVESICANTFHSMILRYQRMAEEVLEDSQLLDSVTIQPGDMVGEERPLQARLQVDSSDSIASPCRVGKEDVASVAVAATLLPSHHFVPKPKTRQNPKPQTMESVSGAPNAMAAATETILKQRPPTRCRPRKSPLLAPTTTPPFHCTLGVRWVGDSEIMQPYPAQGRASDGHARAGRALRKALQKDKKWHKQNNSSNSEENSSDTLVPRKMVQIKQQDTKRSHLLGQRRRSKPYGVFVAIPVYATLAFVTTTLLQNAMAFQQGRNVPTRLTNALPPWLLSRCSSLFALVWATVLRWLPLWKQRAATAKFISI